MSNANDAMRWFVETGWPKIEEAFQRYDIEPPFDKEKWVHLVINLMAEHEPGFRPNPGMPGRKPDVSTAIRDVVLLWSLGPGKPEKKSIRQAALDLTKNRKVCHGWFLGKSPDYLARRYRDLRDRNDPESWSRMMTLVRRTVSQDWFSEKIRDLNHLEN